MGWIRPSDTVKIAVAEYEAGMFSSPAEEELALLLADELDRVDDLARMLEVTDQPAELRGKYRALAALAWLFEHRAEFSDHSP